MTGDHTGAGQSVRSNRSIGRVALSTTALVVGVLWALSFSGPAAAEPEPLPAPSESAASPTLPPLDGPTITSPASGSFIGSGGTRVSGTKDAGTGIQLKLGAALEPVCILPSDEGTAWSCDIELPDGGGQAVTAVEVAGAQTLTAQISVSALGPPTVTTGAPSNGGVRGTAYPGATVTVRADSGASCTFAADSSGSWFCVLGEPLPSGELRVTATQQSGFSGDQSSDASAPVALTIDREAPAAPVMTTPVAGQAIPLGGTGYAGTGEDGATVTVFADSASVCSTVVAGGAWACSGAGVPAGTHVVLAIQQDAAGNTSGASTPLTLAFGDASTAPGTPTPTPSSSPAPSSGAAPPVVPGTQPPGTAQPSPSPSGEPAPGAAPPTGGGGTWAGATPFSKTLASAIDGRGQPVWWLAALLALAAVALVALPARVLATSLAPWRARVAERRRTSLTGRNRARAEFERAPVLHLPGQAAVAAVTAATAAGIVIFAHPVSGQPAYLRLWVASLIAVIALNGAALLGQLVVARLTRLGAMRIVVQPGSLVAVGLVTAISRLLSLQPALLFALLADLRPARPSSDEAHPASAVPARPAGHLALARIAAAALLGGAAWLVSALAGEPSGGFGTLLVEAVNLTAIAGIGSAAIALLPLGGLGGRAVLDWSKPAWLVSSLVVFTLLFGLLGPTATAPGAADTLLGLLMAALAFAAVAWGAWAWRRHIRPMLDAR
ncbi:hypothetical protein KXS11_02590 [Plantibacter flavus]|uniref:hypothetical protein n=1 Tax=Plantibacter flavus TaxID=150123 RepID=UPI003F14D96A